VLLATVGVLLTALASAPAARAQTACVEAVPGFDVQQLRELEGNAAFALVVPDAGPRTSERRARASLVTGEVRNSLRGGLPEGRPLVRLVPSCGDPTARVGIPRGGEQSNDRRYAAVLPGTKGLVVSESTRIPGLISVADLGPALTQGKRLRVEPNEDPVGYLLDLDQRIRDNNRWRFPVALIAAAVIAAIAVAAPWAGASAFAALLLGNLAFGIAGISGAWALLLAVTPLAALPARSWRAAAVLAVGTLAAYLLAFALDERWLALSPLGPTQNSRFFGLSNLLETLILVPALVGAALLVRRYGPLGFAAVALLALVTVAGSSFGADGGGAIVLAVGYAVLAALLVGRRTAALIVGLLAAAVVVALVVGPATHVTEADFPGVLADRVVLSWERATDGWSVGLAVLAALAALAILLVRLPRGPVAVALAAAIGASLIVNDSPLDVAVWGLVAYLAAARWEAGRSLQSASPP
jgi:hypothetical protein